jgi:alpha-L-rhamnosidase
MAGIDIDPVAPGYKHIRIQPRPGGGFTRVSASHQTPYGRVSSAWTRDGQSLDLKVEVPANATATIRLPGARLAGVTESGQALSAAAGLSSPRQDGTDVLVEAGSGLYRFSYAAVK